MGQIFVNNWATQLTADVGASGTALYVSPGEIAKLPGWMPGNFMRLTLIDTGGVPGGEESAWEIVRATAWDASGITVARGQEGTTPVEWPEGSRVEARLTAGALTTLVAGENADSGLDARVCAHRFGGQTCLENSLSALKHCIDTGVQMVETDVMVLSDGSLGIMHDGTVDRMTTGTGEVAGFWRDSWSALRLRPESWWGGTEAAYPQEPVPFLEDVLNLLAGTGVVLRLEIKAPAAAAPAIAMLNQRVWPKDKVIVIAFEQSTLTPAIEDGYSVSLVGYADDTTDWAGLKAAGIDCFDSEYASVTASRVAAAHAAGVKVCAWTVNTRHDAALAFSMGVDYITTDDPLWVSGASRASKRDPFLIGYRWPGFLESFNNNTRGCQLDASAFTLSGAGYAGILAGWACPISDPDNFTLEFDTTITAAASGIGHSDITVVPSDRWWTDSTSGYTQAGFNAFQRLSGEMTLWRINVGSVQNVASIPGNSINLGMWYRYRLEVTPENVRYSNLTTGQSVEVTREQLPDSGAYFYLASGNGDSTNQFRNVRVIDGGISFYEDTILAIEGSAVDMSPRAQTLTPYGGAVFVDGVAVLGGDAYFDTPHTDDFNLPGDYTIEFSARSANTSNRYYGPVMDGSTENVLSFVSFSGRYVGTRNLTMRNNGGIRCDSGMFVNNADWHEWCITRSGSTITMYMDGVLQTTSEWPGTWLISPSLLIGGSRQEPNEQYSIELRRLRVTRAARYHGNSYAVPSTYDEGGAGRTVFETSVVISDATTQFDPYEAALDAGWNGSDDLDLTIVVNAPVGVTDNQSSAAAMTFSFPSGPVYNITLINNSVIAGFGGGGGNGGRGETAGTAGQGGGTAISAGMPIGIENNGIIAGGGGGGGGGMDDNTGSYAGGGGGGGAAAGYIGTGGQRNGGSGSTAAGGTGGNPIDAEWAGNGGNGGAPGQPGQAGYQYGSSGQGGYATGAGGAAGYAVRGNSFVTWITTGTVLGPLGD
jgi:glycerophosphoryl diester phosphodiesterase